MTDDRERRARVTLSRVVEPGDEVCGRWVREVGAREAVRWLSGGEGQPRGMTDSRWAGLRARAERADPEGDLGRAREAGVRFVCPGDAEWPAQLDDLGDGRPLGLWVRGLSSLRIWALRSVAVVGARACTEYGAHMAATLGAGLAERGWVVVSGGAYGVDGAAHRGALGAGGATVAVLACGVDRPYPRGHTQLISRIAEQGLVIGELPPGDHPTPSRFILRNRVIVDSLGVSQRSWRVDLNQCSSAMSSRTVSTATGVVESLMRVMSSVCAGMRSVGATKYDLS